MKNSLYKDLPPLGRRPDGFLYLYYPICEVVGLLHCGRQKAVNTLRELQYAEEVRIYGFTRNTRTADFRFM